VHHAIENAGRDNVTVVVIDVHAVGEARDTSDLAIAGVSLDAVGGENPAEIRAGAEAAATEAPVETEPVEVVGIDSDSDSEDAIPAEGVAASGSDDEGPDTVPVRVPLG